MKAAWSAIQNLANEGFEIENRILEGGAWNVIKPMRNLEVAPSWSIRSIF